MLHSEKKQKETPGGKSFRTNLNKTGKIKKKSIELKKKNKKKAKKKKRILNNTNWQFVSTA